MTDLFYNQGTPPDKLIEECAELIQAVIKYKRFGAKATDPKTNISYDNVADIEKEFKDVEAAIESLRDYWKDLTWAQT